MARLLIVTPNPAIDVTYAVARQRLGETLRVQDVRRLPGGKGINVARVLRALGGDVATLQPLGGASGDWVADRLARLGVPVLPWTIAGETRTTVAVVDGDAHPTLLAEPGPALSDAEWAEAGDAVARAVRAGDWVVVAGSFPPGTTPERIASLVAAAHARGARIAVDTSGPMLLAAAEAGADVVKANEGEVAEATGHDDRDAALRLLARSGAVVVMSRGARGALLRTPDGAVHEQPAVPGVDGNPTGAGDAATAGLIAALAAGLGPRDALAWAAVCGAAAVLSPVAGEIDVDALPLLSARLSPPPSHPLPRADPDWRPAP
ncbi:1-phosphofructokinase family hexose kinase [Microbacterium marinilacus]|uniref:1-phosphofructokinase n=1 Tax=Microbacterium marinilacus TaxID=415209 RepID=A0ABP7BNX4_9MICO|nr:1-phosphofructokinase family hexose kinase [Microbacterium marinilacus]MBY0690293.1 1-phosphofructokinase family hexose kinase [Microbacterium marinilacus]